MDLRPGDVIYAINNRAHLDHRGADDNASRQMKSGDAVVLQVERAGQLMYVAFEMECGRALCLRGPPRPAQRGLKEIMRYSFWEKAACEFRRFRSAP